MGLFSISRKSSEYFNENGNFIELVHCTQGGINCAEHRKVINRNILSAREYFQEKKFGESIEKLRLAYNKTIELQKKECLNCGKLFRKTITHSMEQIHLDLERMSKGFFRSNRFQSSYLLASETLEDFKKNLD